MRLIFQYLSESVKRLFLSFQMCVQHAFQAENATGECVTPRVHSSDK